MEKEILEEKVKQFLELVAKDKVLEKLYTFNQTPIMNPNKEILRELILKPYLLEYDEEEDILYYVDNNNEKRKVPDIEVGVSETKEWISDSLPAIPFDLNQDGNLRRSNEVECMYKCLLISGILKRGFEEEILSVIENYNFERLDKSNSSGITFSELLAKWQELQSITIRVIVSGANYKISSEKNLEVGFLIGSLNREETLGVVSIRDSVKTVIRNYMSGDLSQEKVNKLTKIERLKIIQKKDDEVLSTINSNKKYSELYKICTMSSDYLSPFVKKNLIEAASKFARKELGDVFKDDEKSYKKFVSICTRRAYKEALIALKEKELSRWRIEKNDLYILPKKK